jgi:hypothetical protein
MTTKTITVKSSPEYWENQSEVDQELANVHPDDLVIFHCREGFSIASSGLLKYILDWQTQSGHASELIQLWSWNRKERLPFKNVCNQRNTVWDHAKKNYSNHVGTFVASPKYLFGLFLGRSSVARNVIMYECYHQWQSYFLFSRLKNTQPHYWTVKENIDDWIDSQQQTKIMDWFQTHSIESIDDSQGVAGQQIAGNYSSILSHYNRFGIELVAETMTIGETFYPTEKTTRPIIARKPFVTYATKDFLKDLKKMGFKTFDSIWDESYDQFEGPQRWSRMKQTLQYIIEHPDILSQCQPIVEHNRLCLENLKDH